MTQVYCLLLAQVTAQLWQLVVVHAELPAHLAALKNYFLLAKGDFYHSFLAEVSPHNSHCLCMMTCKSGWWYRCTLPRLLEWHEIRNSSPCMSFSTEYLLC